MCALTQLFVPDNHRQGCPRSHLKPKWQNVYQSMLFCILSWAAKSVNAMTPDPVSGVWRQASYTPASPKGMGDTGFTLTSINPSVDKVSGTFWNNYYLNSFHIWYLPLWGESLELYSFSCSFLQFWPSDGQIFAWKFGFCDIFKKTISSIHWIPGIQPYWVNLLTSIHCHVQLRLCGCQIFSGKWVFWNFVAPWPSSGQNNAVIFLKTKFSSTYPTCVAPTMTAK